MNHRFNIQLRECHLGPHPNYYTTRYIFETLMTAKFKGPFLSNALYLMISPLQKQVYRTILKKEMYYPFIIMDECLVHFELNYDSCHDSKLPL